MEASSPSWSLRIMVSGMRERVFQKVISSVVGKKARFPLRASGSTLSSHLMYSYFKESLRDGFLMRLL